MCGWVDGGSCAVPHSTRPDPTPLPQLRRVAIRFSRTFLPCLLLAVVPHDFESTLAEVAMAFDTSLTPEMHYQHQVCAVLNALLLMMTTFGMCMLGPWRKATSEECEFFMTKFVVVLVSLCMFIAHVMLDVDDPSSIPSIARLFTSPCLIFGLFNMLFTDSLTDHLLSATWMFTTTTHVAPSQLMPCSLIAAVHFVGASLKWYLSMVRTADQAINSVIEVLRQCDFPAVVVDSDLNILMVSVTVTVEFALLLV
mmetsp:Transcript_15164/g.39964  ORF Transcript_15164/g.39964 Transcript_15164/m.39964 type:complete len:253 (-) Transcript_15164:120-878(-)